MQRRCACTVHGSIGVLSVQRRRCYEWTTAECARPLCRWAGAVAVALVARVGVRSGVDAVVSMCCLLFACAISSLHSSTRMATRHCRMGCDCGSTLRPAIFLRHRQRHCTPVALQPRRSHIVICYTLTTPPVHTCALTLTLTAIHCHPPSLTNRATEPSRADQPLHCASTPQAARGAAAESLIARRCNERRRWR